MPPPAAIAPTEAEAEAIRAAYLAAAAAREIPTAILVSRAMARRVEKLSGRAGSVFYPMITRTPAEKGQDVIYVQERTEEKKFIPWTHYSDGEWRNFEPPGPLPFWKPERSRERARLMIHEGAKAAKKADEIASDPRSRHPWARELSLYEHWGMLGGALAGPSRADMAEIRRLTPLVEVVYAADNDLVGKNAVPKFLPLLPRPDEGPEVRRGLPREVRPGRSDAGRRRGHGQSTSSRLPGRPSLARLQAHVWS
jgi:hypothetical protein